VAIPVPWTARPSRSSLAQRGVGPLAVGHVLDGKQDQRRTVFAEQAAGVEEHSFQTDLGEVLLNLEAIEGLLLG
jgi:hypothetical protein